MVDFKKEKCILNEKKGNALLSANRKGNLYAIDMSPATTNGVSCFYTKATSEESWLWHKRLSHLNFKTINKLSKRELVKGLPQMEYAKEKLCNACQKGKQTRTSFKSKEVSSISSPLHLLHMDLFGPVNVMSLGRKRYTLVIVDEYSRYTWVHFLQTKDETPEMIISFIKKM